MEYVTAPARQSEEIPGTFVAARAGLGERDGRARSHELGSHDIGETRFALPEDMLAETLANVGGASIETTRSFGLVGMARRQVHRKLATRHRDPDARVGRLPHRLGERLVHARLGDPEQSQHARRDVGPELHPRGHPRDELVAEHAMHLGRHTGKRGEEGPLVLDHETGGGPERVDENVRAPRDASLLAMPGHLGNGTRREPPADLAPAGLIEVELDGGRRCDHVARAIVSGRAEAARHDDEARASEDRLEQRGTDRRIISDRVVMGHAKAERPELSREKGRVPVDGETVRELAADRDDLGERSRGSRVAHRPRVRRFCRASRCCGSFQMSKKPFANW